MGSVSTANAQFNLLHEFSGGNDDGQRPGNCNLTLSGSSFYGTTLGGGDTNFGVIFKIDTDGSNYTNLHEFTGGNDDGKYSYSALTISGSTLYGITFRGGDSDLGVIFKMDISGSNYTNLHDFAGGAHDGKSTQGNGLTLSNNTLYGMTAMGGYLDRGVIFKINTDGSDYTNLHFFAGGINDGDFPWDSLTLSGDTLYGMTYVGGDSDQGVIFQMKTDGSDFTLIHEFAGGNDDGARPVDNLTLSGSTLFGTTFMGGDSGLGVVFRINTDGSGYTNLHDFAGGSDDGKYPTGSLTLSGSKLYGTTQQGGASDNGVIFEIETDGSGYIHLHDFAGGSDDGKNPTGGLLELGDYFYGMTQEGGASNYGVIFGKLIPEPTLTLITLLAFLGVRCSLLTKSV